MISSHGQVNTFPFEKGQFWDGSVFGWKSTWDFWRPCAQVKELRVNIRPQSCMSRLCSLVESDKEKREGGISKASGWQFRAVPPAMLVAGGKKEESVCLLLSCKDAASQKPCF